MRPSRKCALGGLAIVGGVALLRRGTSTNRLVRQRIDLLARRLRYVSGRLQGLNYRLQGRQPNPEVSDLILADRIRSSLGPIEKRLDLPRIHIMVDEHVALLHGEVGSPHDATEIEDAVLAVPGVLGIESHLHVGLTRGDTRPSAGRAVAEPSAARRRLLDAARSAGLDGQGALAATRAILGVFAERLPADERDHVAAHLSGDVRSMFSPPRRVREHRVRTVPGLVARIVAADPELSDEQARRVTTAVIRELQALVPEEVRDIAAVLPADLREFWNEAAAR